VTIDLSMQTLGRMIEPMLLGYQHLDEIPDSLVKNVRIHVRSLSDSAFRPSGSADARAFSLAP
jgi:hypothetical protein